MNTRIYLHTFGCRVNQADSAALRNHLAQAGFKLVSRDQADIVVINTCTVTAHGDSDTRKLVHRVNRENPKVRIAVIGCQAQLQSEELARLPGVHWVIGNAEKMALARILTQSQVAGPCLAAAPVPRRDFVMPAAEVDANHTRANLKIQDGCDFFCSYCAVPYARGPARSRKFHDLIAAADNLIAAGHQEIVLSGVNIGLYRQDGKILPDVVAAVAARPGLARLRISSIEQGTVGESLIDLMATSPRICPHLHLPLQHAADSVLQRMRRRYVFAEYADFVQTAVDRVPDICIGTDVMVGFPGETDEEFAILQQALATLPLAYFHVFAYSERSVASARKLGLPIPPSEIVKERSRLLRQLSDQRRRAFMSRFIGRECEVLFERRRGTLWNGLTGTFIRVELESAENLRNRLVPVRLLSLTERGMRGELS